MNNSTFKITLLAAWSASLLFISCDKSLYEEDKNIFDKETFSSMSIPDNFDWKMTHSVACEFTSPHVATIEIFYAPECSSETEVMTL